MCKIHTIPARFIPKSSIGVCKFEIEFLNKLIYVKSTPPWKIQP